MVKRRQELRRHPGSAALQQFRRDASGIHFSKPWHQQVLHRVLLGQSPKQIALDLRHSPRTIARLVQTSEFQAEAARALGVLRQKVMSQIVTDPVLQKVLMQGEASLDALVRLRDTASDEAVKVRAASNLLDRYEKLIGQTGEEDDTMFVTETAIDAMAVALQEVADATKPEQAEMLSPCTPS